MPVKPRFHLLVLSRSWSYDYWADIHHEIPSHSITDHGPSSFMEHLVATFDAQPPDAVVQALLDEHDKKIALYDGHMERTAFAVVDDKAWSACKVATPWRYCNSSNDCVYHPITAFKALMARYPNITSQAISAPAMPDACGTAL